MTRVWPALWPPWKRTTTSARSDSQSTILPFPSSPHWAPTTATFAMPPPRLPRAPGRARLAALQHIVAIEPARFVDPIGRRQECGDRDPALGAQGIGVRAIGLERHQDAATRSRPRQGAQDHVSVESKAGRGLRGHRIAGFVAAAAAEFAEGSHGGTDTGKEREADAGMV